MRYLTDSIKNDQAEEKIVFLSGPRQVGKTTLALSFLKPSDRSSPAYLNWDHDEDRSKIRKLEFPAQSKLIVFDEIHKYARWKKMLKGLYDKRPQGTSFLVTGSARLDTYQKGGDSLFGRSHLYRLHPFTADEITPLKAKPSDVKTLMQFGGFPEPWTKQSELFSRRWRLERNRKIMHEDLRDLERVREISLIELLLHSLPERVGSPLSVQSLRENLEVSHETVERWLQILERLFLVYRIPPFGAPRLRAVKKEQKLYFWDWSSISTDGGARFENMAASHLLKCVHFLEDVLGYPSELRYFRDIDRREVDFVLLKSGKPFIAVECKTGERGVSGALKYLSQRQKIPHLFQVHLGNADYVHADSKIRVLPFSTFSNEILSQIYRNDEISE